MGNVESIRFFAPELIIVATTLLIILLDLFSVDRRRNDLAIITLIGIGATLTAVVSVGNVGKSLFLGMVMIDGFSIFFKILVLMATAVTVIFSVDSEELDHRTKGEYYTLLMAIMLGMFLMAGATNLLMAYLALEMVSLTSYILVGFLTHNPRSSEASFKYITYGAVASGTMLFGMSLIFGMTGTADLALIGERLPEIAEAYPLPVLVSIIFVLAGVGYKIASVPFHMWSPDVYEGAPIPITAFLSVASKASGFALLLRIFYAGFGQSTEFVNWTLLLSMLSALTMTVGNLVALPQKNVKRLLAYSSIAHGGYLLMGATLLTDQGVKAILFYLLVYLFMNLGAFAVVLMVAKEVGSEQLDGYRGLAYRMPIVAISMAIFLFSLTGLPPLAGFAGKWVLFAAAIENEVYWLAIVGLLNSVVSLYYYVGIVRAMFFERSSSTDEITVSHWRIAWILLFATPTILLGIYWKPYEFLENISIEKIFGA